MITVDIVFEICGKLREEIIFKTIIGKDPENIDNSKNDFVSDEIPNVYERPNKNQQGM